MAWVYPAVLKLRADSARILAESAELERQDHRLDNGGGGWRARDEQDAIRVKLRALDREEKAVFVELMDAEELEKVVNTLLPHHAERTARATSIIEAIQRSPDLPTRETLTELSLASQDAELLRRTLFEITKDTKFAKSADYIDAVRFFWFQQNATRERALLNVTSPGHRPRRSEPAPWAVQLQRVAELRAASKEEYVAR